MLEDKLKTLKTHDDAGRIRVMIIGLGSVGNYLLDYLLSNCDEKLEIVVAGRNAEKMQQDVNIARVAATIRRRCRSEVRVADGVDLESVDSIVSCLKEYKPDFIVNSSRVYAGLKYGSISWTNVRAYGIWIPLSIKYIRNIMQAYERAECNALVINTSYSDGTLPWLKTAGIACPDFGSGNLNHLIPRIRYAVAAAEGIRDYWNLDVRLATAHFHDVVISKEGQNEGVKQLLKVFYEGRELNIDQDAILSQCKIAMPVDAKRNMMNASSNYEIIDTILRAIRGETVERVFSPGVFGEIGGYPVCIDGKKLTAAIDDSTFTMEEMRQKNRESIALDGIESIERGVMTYTDALIEKTKTAFGVELPKRVALVEVDMVAEFIMKEIIQRYLLEK